MFFARTHCMKNTLTCTSCLCCTYTVNVMIAGKCHWSEWGTGLNTLYFCSLHRNTELVLSVKNTVSVEQCHIGLGALPACRLAHLLRINVHSGRLTPVIKTIYCNAWYTVSAWCWWSTLSEVLPGFDEQHPVSPPRNPLVHKSGTKARRYIPDYLRHFLLKPSRWRLGRRWQSFAGSSIVSAAVM